MWRMQGISYQFAMNAPFGITMGTTNQRRLSKLGSMLVMSQCSGDMDKNTQPGRQECAMNRRFGDDG